MSPSVVRLRRGSVPPPWFGPLLSLYQTLGALSLAFSPLFLCKRPLERPCRTSPRDVANPSPAGSFLAFARSRTRSRPFSRGTMSQLSPMGSFPPGRLFFLPFLLRSLRPNGFSSYGGDFSHVTHGKIHLPLIRRISDLEGHPL